MNIINIFFIILCRDCVQDAGDRMEKNHHRLRLKFKAAFGNELGGLAAGRWFWASAAAAWMPRGKGTRLAGTCARVLRGVMPPRCRPAAAAHTTRTIINYS